MSTIRTATLSVVLTLVLVMVVYAGFAHSAASAAAVKQPGPAISVMSNQEWQSILNRRFAHMIDRR